MQLKHVSTMLGIKVVGAICTNIYTSGLGIHKPGTTERVALGILCLKTIAIAVEGKHVLEQCLQ